MKYHNYTWNTGHCLHHDSAVDLMPDIIPAVRRLIQQAAGPVPAVPAHYQLIAEPGGLAALTVTGHNTAPIWTTLFYITPPAAAKAHHAAAQMHVDKSPALPARLLAPGLLTVILPSAMIAGITLDHFEILADFAKTTFAVWATYTETIDRGHTP